MTIHSAPKITIRDDVGNAISDLRRCVYCLVGEDDEGARVFFNHAMGLLNYKSRYVGMFKQLKIGEGMTKRERLHIADKILTNSNIINSEYSLL